MEQGLAAQMVYGNGENQNTKHFYAGVKKPVVKKKKCKVKVKK
jgi:hypothetical protein